jgi:hypothetical protein
MSVALNDGSDDDYSSNRLERKPIERLIEESPDKVVKMNSIEYHQLPVIDQARVFYLNLLQQNGSSNKQTVEYASKFELKQKLKTTLRMCYRSRILDERRQMEEFGEI